MFANIQNYHNNKLKIKNLQFDKLQVHVFKFTSLYLYTKLPNQQINKITKITKLEIASAFLCIYKFAHAKFACFHTCMYYEIIRL